MGIPAATMSWNAWAQAPAAAPAANPNYWDWFKYSPKILEKWIVDATESPHHVEIEPIRRTHRCAQAHAGDLPAPVLGL